MVLYQEARELWKVALGECGMRTCTWQCCQNTPSRRQNARRCGFLEAAKSIFQKSLPMSQDPMIMSTQSGHQESLE